MSYDKKYYKHKYTFDLLSFESVITFLHSLGYEVQPFNEEHDDDRYMETTIEEKLCAIKPGETPNLYTNEINVVFRKEFEKVLLSLLINARDINYYEQLIKEQNK